MPIEMPKLLFLHSNKVFLEKNLPSSAISRRNSNPKMFYPYILASGYGLAVGSAMGVSFILNKQLAKHGHKLKPNVRSTVQKIVPFTAVACASCKYDSFL